LSERSPLPQALSAKVLPGGRTQILNVRRIRTINHYPVEIDDNSPLESISDAENCLNWNGDMDNSNNGEVNCAPDNEPDIEHNNGIQDPDCQEKQDVNATPNVPRLVWPTQKSKRQTERVFVMVNTIETSRNEGVKKK